MDKNKLMQQLMGTFLVELGEHVESMERDLLALEKGPVPEDRAELIKSVFRSAHTIKGASRVVGGGPIADVSHRMEEILSAVRDDRLTITPELFALLFTTVDAIADAGMRLRDEQSLDDSPLNDLLPQLEEAAGAALTDFPNADTPATATPATATPSTAATKSQAAVRTAKDETNKLKAPSAKKPSPAPESKAQAKSDDAWTATPAVPQENELAPAKKPQDSTGPAESSAPKPATPSATVRVAAEKLDALLAQSGELLVARRRVESRVDDIDALRERIAAWQNEWRAAEKPLRQMLAQDSVAAPDRHRRTQVSSRAASVVEHNGERLRELERALDRVAANIRGDGRLLAQTCDALDDEVHHVRMFPFAEACGGLERVIRDVARSAGKEVQLVIEGEEVEVDRSVLEGLKDPLLHLVRNAVDHGIELPDERERVGKPRQATVTVSAALRGTQVEVVVTDDGRGFDLEAIREKARSRHLPEPSDDRELARVVFMPGFSTASMITDVSGRGVGLDVVQSRIEGLHGSVDVSFEAGGGTRFTLAVPLTLTTIRTVLVLAAGQTFALATTNVVQLARFGPEKVRSVAGRETLLMGDAPLPIVSLAETIGFRRPEKDNERQKMLGVILAAGQHRVVFVVDDVLAEQEIVVKNLGARIRRVRNVSGATLLPSGSIALVLNVANLVRTALGLTPSRKLMAAPAEQKVAAKRRLMVVEDSMTTRALMKSILETAGFDVVVAVDGEQAWKLLPESKVDLVVCDVDMPQMDGFRLTEAIRSSQRHPQLPVVLVTARETEEDKIRGIEAGANAYLVKSGFDQTHLLETIGQLL